MASKQTKSNTTGADLYISKAEVGCWGDGARGIYLGEHVQEIARAHGWAGHVTPCGHDPEGYEDCQQHGEEDHGDVYYRAWDEAEEHLNTLAPEGHFFGSSEAGDFGLWPVEDDDEQRAE